MYCCGSVCIHGADVVVFVVVVVVGSGGGGSVLRLVEVWRCWLRMWRWFDDSRGDDYDSYTDDADVDEDDDSDGYEDEDDDDDDDDNDDDNKK